jgi:hypothetical protein
MITLICPPEISPVRAAFALRGLRQSLSPQTLTEAELLGLFHYGYIDRLARPTREGEAFAEADDAFIQRAQNRWRRAFGGVQ